MNPTVKKFAFGLGVVLICAVVILARRDDPQQKIPVNEVTVGESYLKDWIVLGPFKIPDVSRINVTDHLKTLGCSETDREKKIQGLLDRYKFLSEDGKILASEPHLARFSGDVVNVNFEKSVGNDAKTKSRAGYMYYAFAVVDAKEQGTQ